MKNLDEKYVKEIYQLIKSLLIFCKYELTINKGEINLICSVKDLTKILLFLKDNQSLGMECLIDVTAVDFPEKTVRFMVVYSLLSISKNFRLKVKVNVSEDSALPSVNEIYSSAGWCEREIWDLFGIRFKDHPDLRRLLTDYDFQGHPLRKDFPLTGFNEVRYSEKEKKVIYEPVKLEQNYRNFDFESPWEGTNYLKEVKRSEKHAKKN